MFNLLKVQAPDQARPLSMVDRKPDIHVKALTTGPYLRRTLPTETDRTLSAVARTWLRRLPAPMRPLALCSTYARLANRLAAVWDDPVQTEALFDELLIDHRGGRHGFAPMIANELMRLHHHHERRLGRP